MVKVSHVPYQLMNRAVFVFSQLLHKEYQRFLSRKLNRMEIKDDLLSYPKTNKEFSGFVLR
jgi:hypothetical protein